MTPGHRTITSSQASPRTARRTSMKKTSTLGIIAIAALLIALVLTLIFGGALWDVGGNGALQGLGGWLKLPMADLHLPRRRAVLPVAGPAGLLVPEQGVGRRPGRAAGAVQFHQHRAQVVLQTQPAVLGGPGAATGRRQPASPLPAATRRPVPRCSATWPGSWPTNGGAAFGLPCWGYSWFSSRCHASTWASISSAISSGARPSG